MPSLLEEKDTIRELLATYCFCSDRGDVDGFIALFTEDCVWDGGPWGRMQGRLALREFFLGATSGEGRFRHMNVNHVITISGDTASVRSYVLVLKAVSNPPLPFFIGFYEDALVKIDGRWLFKERIMKV